MSSFNQCEDYYGALPADFDWSTYMAQDVFGITSPVLAVPEVAPQLQPVHEISLEELTKPGIEDTNSHESSFHNETTGNSTAQTCVHPELLVQSLPQNSISRNVKVWFRNTILNSFSNPIIPLTIIDKLFYPFDDKTQAVLADELERENSDSNPAVYTLQGDSKDNWNIIPEVQAHHAMPQDCSSTVVPYEAPEASHLGHQNHTRPIPPPYQQSVKHRSVSAQHSPVSPPRGHNKKKGGTRTQNRLNFDPAEYYRPLASKPESWGSRDGFQKHSFRYTAKGELLPEIELTATQVREFIQHHPLNYPKGSSKADTINSGLVIWIQSVPSDSKLRYGNPEQSNKCRFADCIAPNRTIWKGDYRVAFDEQSTQRMAADPFHCAAYFHLFCMEKYFDFPQICADYNVQPDIRILLEGKNKMAITRDHPGMLTVVEDYLDKFEWPSDGRPANQQTEYLQYLNYKLTRFHLSMQCAGRQKERGNRKSYNSIEKHMNNLEVYSANIRNRLALKKANAVRAEERGLDVLEAEDEIFQKGSPSPGRKKKSRRHTSPNQSSRESDRATRKRKAQYQDAEEGSSDLDAEVLERDLASPRSSKRSKTGKSSYSKGRVSSSWTAGKRKSALVDEEEEEEEEVEEVSELIDAARCSRYAPSTRDIKRVRRSE